MKPEIIFEDNLLVGESPVWDCKENKLYFVDIMDGMIGIFLPT